ncbi:hypothetical protein JIN84_10585 [Luteolibacter yonseiensis]|uniref:Uncharacterized protein n=1 Tax=Luteolibacter yonseiensis TaxID=1144680 RepID=A0A934R382_9BACT|nr:hypothetical protein [Luteolibacter yonseiensis]MBK1816059.1 hypothetical protein [Luteolibacter yonseiensis]
MKIVIESVGGHSPAIMIVGEPEDLVRLGAQIQNQAEIVCRSGDIDREIPVDDVSVDGMPFERLSLKPVKNIEHYQHVRRSDGRWDKLVLAGIILFVLGILFFTFQGIRAVFFER